MQVQTQIRTSNPYYAQDGSPMAGLKLVYYLERDDVDRLTGSLIVKQPEQFVLFDSNGQLPINFGVWPNSRGTNGSRWMFGLTQGATVVQAPVPVFIQEVYPSPMYVQALPVTVPLASTLTFTGGKQIQLAAVGALGSPTISVLLTAGLPPVLGDTAVYPSLQSVILTAPLAATDITLTVAPLHGSVASGTTLVFGNVSVVTTAIALQGATTININAAVAPVIAGTASTPTIMISTITASSTFVQPGFVELAQIFNDALMWPNPSRPTPPAPIVRKVGC
jgi:hypothetical protein